jgi:hypothetical protein
MADFTFSLKVDGNVNGKVVSKVFTMTVGTFLNAVECVGDLPLSPLFAGVPWSIPAEQDAVAVSNTSKTSEALAAIGNTGGPLTASFLLKPGQFFVLKKGAGAGTFQADNSTTAVTVAAIDSLLTYGRYEEGSYNMLTVDA